MVKLLVAASVSLTLFAASATASTTAFRSVSKSGNDTGDCVLSPCKTIGFALSKSSSGDAIVVSAGTYGESVAVTKRIALIGHNATIDATGHDNGVVISGPAAAGSSLRGFTIENADLEGVLVQATSRISITDNDVVANDALWDPDNVPEPCQSSDDCGEGLHLLSVTDSTVRGNDVHDNVGGILLTDEAGPTARNLILDNTVEDNEKDCGITLASHYFSFAGPAPAALGGVYDNTVLGNSANRNGAAGIGVFTGPPGAAAYRNLIAANIAQDNGLPGVAMHSHTPGQYLNDNVVIANIISGNGADDDAETGAPTGIAVWSAVVPIPRTTITANRISNEHFGIFAHNTVQLPGLSSNKFVVGVDVPVSIS